MKKIVVFGILVLILGGFVLAQEKDNSNVDRTDTSYQSQITSSPDKSEKENGKSYEKTLSIANISIIVATLVVGFVALLAAILGALGFYGYFQTGKMRGKIAEELEEIKKLRVDVSKECEMAKKQRDDIDKIKTVAESRLKEVEFLYENTKEIAEKVIVIDKGIDKKKEATEKAERRTKAWSLFSEADALGKKGELEEAISRYKLALKHNPEHGPAYTDLAAVLIDLGREKKEEELLIEGIEKCEKAIEYLDKIFLHIAYNNWGNALSALAKLRADEKLYLESFDKYNKAIEYNSNYCEAYSNWGAALLGLGKLKEEKQYFKEALEKTEKAIEIKKDYASAWFNKACAHSLLKEKEKALGSLKRAIELDSKYKKMAKEDDDFKWLWDDEDFKKLVE